MKKLLTLALVGAMAGGVFADYDYDVGDEPWMTPIEINLASPLGLPWADRDVYGIRCNLLYGHSLDVMGVDVGIVGGNRGDCYGLQANCFNFVDGFFAGVQLGALGSFTSKPAYGLQLAGLVNWGLDDGAGVELGLLNFSGAYTGVQLGFLNWDSGLDSGLALGAFNIAAADFEGAEVGFMNYCKGNLEGCQLGVFNMVFGHSDGLQIGLFNASDDHSGAQIGLLNFNAGGCLVLMPIVNVYFR